MHPAENRVIKSAKRVLEILEYFDSEHTEATVMDIVRELKYPQSSASELLRSLVVLGYLVYDRHARVYKPTAKIPLLGTGVQARFFGQSRLLAMMDEIHASTGEAVVLGTEVGFNVQYIHVLQSDEPGQRRIAKGTRLPLLRSGMGKAILTRFSDAAIRGVVHRLNAEESDPDTRVNFRDLIDEVAQFRSQGYVVSVNRLRPGFGMVSVLLPQLEDGQNQAIGVASYASVINERCEHYVRLVRQAIDRYLFTRRPVSAVPEPVRLPSLAGPSLAERFDVPPKPEVEMKAFACQGGR